MAKNHFAWREPAVTLGKPKPVPERRPEVLAEIKTRLEKEPRGFRFEYSNGEFTSSSLCIAATFAECKDVPTLETSSYTVHFDEVNKFFWRHGGCFD